MAILCLFMYLIPFDAEPSNATGNISGADSLMETLYSEASICHRTVFLWCSNTVMRGRADPFPFEHDLFQSCPCIVDNETQQKLGMITEETGNYRG